MHSMLFEKMIDLIYGEYDPSTISPEKQAQYIDNFRERMTKWKRNKEYRRIIGPLQPAHIFSRMAKVPIDVIEDIIANLDLALPTKVDVSEFSLDSLSKDETEALWKSLDQESSDDDHHDQVMDILVKAEEAMGGSSDSSQSPFEVVDLTDASVIGNESTSTVLAAVSYMEGIIEKLKAGEVHAITLVALLTDGQAALWIPAAIEDDSVSDIYDPIIEILKNSGPMTNYN